MQNLFKVKLPIIKSLIILFICFSNSAFAQNLQIYTQNQSLLLDAPVDVKCGFIIKYTHSVALSPVEDYFTIADGKISLKKTVYKDFGAGLPHQPEPGQKMVFKNGAIEISGYDLKIPELELRIGRIANHELVLLKEDSGVCARYKTYTLSDFDRKGKTLIFKPKSLN